MEHPSVNLNYDLMTLINHSGIEKTLKKKLSKYTWQLNDNHTAFNLEWKIAAYTSPYKCGTHRSIIYPKREVLHY